MDKTISVSKGCFVFKNGATKADRRSRKAKAGKVRSLLETSHMKEMSSYRVYSETWKQIQNDVDTYQIESNAKTIKELIEFVNSAYDDNYHNFLPTAALLTGINQPDHCNQFQAFAQKLHEKLSARVIILQARDCPTLKNAIESMVFSFLDEFLDDEENESDSKKIRKSHCNMEMLEEWYASNDDLKGRKLVVTLPDFECFKNEVIEDLIIILGNHCQSLPIVLVLGVATLATSIHNTLPYHVTRKMRIRLFQTQSANEALNQIIEYIVLSPKLSFHLSGKLFKLLTDIFLFYDFSLNGFVQGFKYCLLEHFFTEDPNYHVSSLCTEYSRSLENIKELNHDDFEAIRRLPSFRPYVESFTNCKQVILILIEDDYLKKQLPKILKNCHIFLKTFSCFIEFFVELIKGLPKTLLGSQLREIYSVCISSNVMELPEFKESWQVLTFLSKDEFIAKLTAAVEKLWNYTETNFSNKDVISRETKNIVQEKVKKLKYYIDKVATAGTESSSLASNQQAELKDISRHELKEKLLLMAKQSKPISEFIKSVNDTLDYVKTEIIAKHLIPLNTGSIPLLEIFVFSDVASVRKHIVGAPRGAIHTALNNPRFYLQCHCCILDTPTSLLSTLPDISIAYKLHLECGRMINLFDWLQSFRCVVDDDVDDQNDVINPEIQARFTRAVAELQFLGFIKSSKRKTDHVTRLTW